MRVTESGQGVALAQHLKAATRADHQRLDHQFLLARLLAKSLAVADYAATLAALHGPQSALEALCRSHLECLEGAPALSGRSQALVADLDDLGVDPLPLSLALPDATSPARLVGIMYVLEGSRLGSMVISRQLHANLPAATPRRFFAGSGDPLRWPAFWQFANRQAGHTAQLADVVEAAHATYALFFNHLEACVPGAAGKVEQT